MAFLTQVAIKRLPIGQTRQEKLLFTREIIKTIELSRKCSRLVQCYGYSMLNDGQTCLVMKLYGGGTLHTLLGDLGECAASECS